MKSIRPSFLGVMCVLAICSAAQAEQITFQGFSSSSIRSDVQARFLNAGGGKEDLCDQDQPNIRIGRAFMDCDTLEVSDFDFLEMKFNVRFTFDGMTHKLLFVNLIHRWADQTEPDNPNRLTRSAILAQYMQLRTKMISIRGMPRREPFSCVTDNGRMYHACDTWQGAPGDLPDDKLGSIYLYVHAEKASASDQSYDGNFGFSYTLTAATLTNDMPAFPPDIKRVRKRR
jgi:hypothetical protein